MALIKFTGADGSWERLKTGWGEQCVVANEDFALYAPGTFHILDQLAATPERRSGIYGIQRADEPPDVICQINTTPLPGHPAPVMRVRMVTVCPAIDFGTFPATKYIDTLGELFFGIVELSQDATMGADEFKLHLRSPEDFNFFRAVAGQLAKLANFSHVSVHGSWLHVTKA